MKLIDWGELWRYRELLGLLVWRNTVVRYKQSVIGIGWAILKPVIQMVIFSIIFGRLAGLPSDGLPYPIMLYVGLLPWLYFASCLSGAGNSLVTGAHLIRKGYFPRLILPLSQLVTGLVDFLFSFIVLLGMMAWYRDSISVTWYGVLCLPVFLALAMLSGLAVGLWATALMVKYRDIQQLLPFVLEMWKYLTPVVYSASLIPDRFRLLFSLNPMTGVVDGFRWALLGVSVPDWRSIAISTAKTFALLIGGLHYFRWTERTMVDIV